MPDKNDSASVLNIIIRVGDSIFLNGKVDLCKELFNLLEVWGWNSPLNALKCKIGTYFVHHILMLVPPFDVSPTL